MKILLIDDDKKLCSRIEDFAAAKGWESNTTESGFDGLNWLAIDDFDAILLGTNLKLIGAQEVSKRIRKRFPQLPVIFLVGGADTRNITDLYSRGAFDVICKPPDEYRLAEALAKAAAFTDTARGMRRADLILPSYHGFGDFIGSSRVMQEVYRKLDRILDTDLPVMLTGESGTGKEVAARTIMKHGYLKDAPFVSVNCAAIPETLQESEMFGYEKGAFTGAVTTKQGKFEAANGGTLFLDEIGDMSLPLQAKILRFIENGEIERVGGTVRKDVKTRLLTASNKDLAAEVNAGKFREDLYHRLNVYPIYLPPLRNRKGDIPLLTSYFLHEMPTAGKSAGNDGAGVTGMTAGAIESLNSYEWRGNVRELYNVLRRIAVSTTGVIDADAVAATLRKPPSASTASTGPKTIEELVSGTIAVEEIRPLQTVEMEAILSALKITEGNVQRASRALGITRATLYNKLKKYNITVKRVVRAET